jgi:hypothetical protein
MNLTVGANLGGASVSGRLAEPVGYRRTSREKRQASSQQFMRSGRGYEVQARDRDLYAQKLTGVAVEDDQKRSNQAMEST